MGQKIESKTCPNCNEKNNPILGSCWKCGVILNAGETPLKEVQSLNLGGKVRYFQVSPARFIIFSLITMGIYDLYWCYRNWKLIRDQAQRKLSPFWRAFFAIFFIYDLFKTVQLSAQTKGWSSKYSAGTLAAGWIILRILGNLSSRIPDAYLIGWILWYFSLVGFVFILPVLRCIKYVNESEGIGPREDNKFTAGQIIMLVLGCIFWLLFLLGMVLPGAQTT